MPCFPRTPSKDFPSVAHTDNKVSTDYETYCRKLSLAHFCTICFESREQPSGCDWPVLLFDVRDNSPQHIFTAWENFLKNKAHALTNRACLITLMAQGDAANYCMDSASNQQVLSKQFEIEATCSSSAPLPDYFIK